MSQTNTFVWDTLVATLLLCQTTFSSLQGAFSYPMPPLFWVEMQQDCVAIGRRLRRLFSKVHIWGWSWWQRRQWGWRWLRFGWKLLLTKCKALGASLLQLVPEKSKVLAHNMSKWRMSSQCIFFTYFSSLYFLWVFSPIFHHLSFVRSWSYEWFFIILSFFSTFPSSTFFSDFLLFEDGSSLCALNPTIQLLNFVPFVNM